MNLAIYSCSMRPFFTSWRWLLLGMGILALSQISACSGGAGGGGGGRGSEATPGAIGSQPIAVEIPAVGDVSDVMYITSPVMTSAGDAASAKSATKSSGATPYKVLSNEGYGPGDSVNACEIANGTRGLLKSGAHADMELCVLKNHIFPGLTAAGLAAAGHGMPVDAAAWVVMGQDPALITFRFSLAKNTRGAVTQFDMAVCLDKSQLEYTREVFNPDTGAVTITSKSVEGNPESPYYTAAMTVAGVVQTITGTAQYTAKHSTQSSRQVTLIDGNGNPVDIRSQSSVLEQDASNGTFDGFITNEGPYSTVTDRSYGYFDLTYAGDPAAATDLNQYDIGAGASLLIEDPLDQSQCWSNNGAVAAFPCPPYSDAISGKKPMTPGVVAQTSFGPGEAVDCASITPVYTAGTQDAPIDLATSVCAGFARDLDDHMDCFTNIYGDFTVAATANSQPLSTNSNRPTHVGNTPTILLTTNYTPGMGSFTGNTIKLAWDGACQEPWTHAAFERSHWSNAATAQQPEAMALALHPMLCNTVYTLTLSDDLSGINLNPIKSPQTYYITP